MSYLVLRAFFDSSGRQEFDVFRDLTKDIATSSRLNDGEHRRPTVHGFDYTRVS
jgi:hypothetical protein